MVFICTSWNLHITLMIQLTYIWFWEKKNKSFLIVIYVQNWTPMAWTTLLWAINMYKVESALNEETSCQIQWHSLSSSWESCFSIATCAIVGPHRPWGFHWSYLEYTLYLSKSYLHLHCWFFRKSFIIIFHNADYVKLWTPWDLHLNKFQFTYPNDAAYKIF